MKNIQDHLIHFNYPVIEALKRLNQLPQTLTLFVVNDSDQLLGTLTDGDIRRGLVAGKTLETKVEEFMPDEYQYLEDGVDTQKIKKTKEKGMRLLPVVDKNKKIIKVYDLYYLHSVLPLDAVIMAGGRGQRLRPITDSIPKPMIKLGNKPIIEHNVDRLISYGIEKIYISVNYLKGQIKDYFGDGHDKGISIEYIEEDQPLGTAGALSLVNHFQQDVLLINSDIFTNIDYEDLYFAFKNKNADLAIASVPYTVNIPYAVLEEQGSYIKNFREKPINTHYANAGIYLIRKELIEVIPNNEFYNTTDLMDYSIQNNLKVIHNQIIGYWIDIGKHEDLEKAIQIVEHLI